jgi:hypothetical protein
MEAELGRFAAFYGSFLHHPVLLWVATLAAIAFCRTRSAVSHDVRRFCTALGLLSLCDAWLTANHVVGFRSLPDSLATVVPLCFVLLGDFRFFLFLATATEEGRFEFRARPIAVAAGATVVVPLFTQIALALLPEGVGSARVMFLIYEVTFFCLTLGLIRWYPRIRKDSWLRPVTFFVALYYSLWASSDAIILYVGSDVGYLLRVAPNLLYYGGLIAVIANYAPRTTPAPETR